MARDKVERMRARESVLGYRMGPGLLAVAAVEGELSSAGRLVQLSPEHLTLSLSRPTALRPGQTANVVLGLGAERTSLKAEVMNVHVPGPEAPPELSLRFVAPALDQGRHIVSMLEGWRDKGQLETPRASPIWKERLTRADRIGRIFEALTARRCQGMARASSGDVELTAALYDKYDGRVSWEASGVLPSGPFAVEVFGYSSVLHFLVEHAVYEDGLWSVSLPREVMRYRHRKLRRASAWGGCAVRFAHPLWPQVRVERELMDISYEGLSFSTEPGADLLYPGLMLPEVVVALPGGEPVRLRAEVRNITGTGLGRRCGMRVEPADEQEGARWRRLVEEQSHPNTRVSGEWNRGTWELFERSGYFRLSGKTPADFERMQAEYREAHERLEGHPRLGYRVVRPMPGGETVEASLSWLKPYSGSWLGHQLARQQPRNEKSRSTARDALRDIYLRGFEPAQMDPELKWFLAYCEANVKWVKFTTFDFAEWYQHTGQACMVPFRFMEADARREWSLPEGFSLGAPTYEEKQALFERLKQTRPEAYREALDLVPERFDLAELKRQWAEAKLTRERDVLVARKDGRALAVGVLETAHAGLNLFHVLDGLRIVPLVDEASAQAQEAMLALLAGAAAWYRARGLDVFVHYVETEHTGYTERAQLKDLGEGRIWILSAQLLPDFIEHLHEATTPRGDP
ncbi:PilZ domain-containing protein [Vitiosangium sp. GDMCC 1.1324]|uniref:PilZ domain-containing protein n=1 Tax=Vitiosangium sp. (strain GDMCC 1.1324) TaxID=2138576 RepID=UPI000D3A4B6A|nr:PilZ domain-containing protein [Vitiosangium sp. GDMCC 1.1324]PTL77051.1 PilZ domain-containing protein [Vitiosangium sp. GDMCC 1.1324]